MSKIKKLLLFHLLSFMSSMALALDLQGSYTCKGYDPFTGTNYINYHKVKQSGDNYFFQWVDKKGYPTAYGTGVLNKNLQNTIAVVYENITDKQKGLVLYNIKADGSLQGTWTIQTDNKVGTETCTKQ